MPASEADSFELVSPRYSTVETQTDVSLTDKRSRWILVGDELDESVPEPLPTKASSTGKRYYAAEPRHGLGPQVFCSWSVAQTCLGGWGGRGRAPLGYNSLDDAVNAVVRAFKGRIRQIVLTICA